MTDEAAQADDFPDLYALCASAWNRRVAALSTMGDVVAVGELITLAEDWEHTDVGSDYFACAQELRAILSRGGK